MRVVITGAGGKMGKANIDVFYHDDDSEIVGAVERMGSPLIGKDAGSVAGIGDIGVKITDSLTDCIENADVVIDFTNPEATIKNLDIIKNYKKAVVIGTTGLSDDDKDYIRRVSDDIPVVFSPNMSIGINTLFYLVRRATELLGDSFEVEIVEIHHNQKKDSPSGTALAFGRIIADVRGVNFDEAAIYGRKGMVGKRSKGEIGIHAVRLADVVGEHTIIFGGPGERVEFTHKSNSRKTFASGALRAAKFIVNKDKGLYSMEDVLGLK